MDEWERFFDMFQLKLRYFVKNSGRTIGPICREQLHEDLEVALDLLGEARISTYDLRS